MAEAQRFVFDYKEVAEALIQKQGIHEGLWGVYIEFGLGAGMVPFGPSEVIAPAAVIPVKGIGIQRFAEPNSLTVDAAEVNPGVSGPPALGSRTPSRRRTTRQKHPAAG